MGRIYSAPIRLEKGALRILELNLRFGGSLVGVVTDYGAAHLAAL